MSDETEVSAISAVSANGSEKEDEPARAQRKVPIQVQDPAALRGEFKRMGGSQCDKWNKILASQVGNTLWLAHSDEEQRTIKCTAAIQWLIGIAPRDELEGMMAVQLIAHSAAMECYRRAMLSQQTFEGQREYLTQAIERAAAMVRMIVLARLGSGGGTERRVAALGSAAARLLRAYATQVELLRRLRHGGRQYIRVDHVYVGEGGRAIIGNISTPAAVQSLSDEDKAQKDPVCESLETKGEDK